MKMKALSGNGGRLKMLLRKQEPDDLLKKYKYLRCYSFC